MKNKPLNMSKNLLLCISCIAIGAILVICSSISITAQNQTSSKQNRVLETHYNIFSPAGIDARLNLVSSSKIYKISLNNKKISVEYNYPKTRVSHQDAEFGDIYRLPLERGINKLKIETLKKNGQARIKLAQKHSFKTFLIASVLILIPSAYLLLYFCLPIVNLSIRHWTKRPKVPLALVIVGLGIFIRLVYSLDMGFIQFQHDYHGHVEYISFIAHEFFVPIPHKAWEFPQQPLYYLITGSLYAALEYVSVDKENILKVISFVTSALSGIGLIYAYRLVRLLHTDTLVHNLTMGFLCFTPTLIYMSARINNDPWAATFSCIAFFYIISSYKNDWQKHLYKALLFCSFAFLCKISALIIEAFFLILLTISYIAKPEKMRKPIYATVFIGCPILAYTLFRAYYPAPNALAMVNSGIWPGQDLRPIKLDYLLSFNIFSLLQEGQSHIGQKLKIPIAHSFPTYQFSTMLFGEFDYTYWRNQSYSLFINMQALIVFALVIPIGWISFALKQKNTLERLFAFTILLSLLLQLHFIFSYPSVSNTDFRYHAIIFFPLAYIFALGISQLAQRFPKTRYISQLTTGTLFLLCITFMITLIKL